MTRKPADTATEFVPDMLKTLRTQELSIRELADELGQEHISRVQRWAKALTEQGMLRKRILARPRMQKTAAYTLAKEWGGELDK